MYFAQFDPVSKKVLSVVQSDKVISGANIVTAPDYSVLGKTWNGVAFV